MRKIIKLINQISLHEKIVILITIILYVLLILLKDNGSLNSYYRIGFPIGFVLVMWGTLRKK